MIVRKKPVEVEAWLIKDLLKMGQKKWPKVIDKNLVTIEAHNIVINTLEGQMAGWPEWYLIRGVQGEFYPCDPDIFAKTYDVISE